MKYLTSLLILIVLFSCESISTDSDKKKLHSEPSENFVHQSTDPKKNGPYRPTSPYDYSFKSNGITHTGRVIRPYTRPYSYTKFPLVMYIHGVGNSIYTQNTLSNRLASHGFYTVSIEWENGVKERVEKTLRKHLNYIYKNYLNLNNDIVIIGASQGGAIAYKYAKIAKEYGKNLKSLVLVAPNRYYRDPGNSKTYHVNYKQRMDRLASSLLVLYSTSDRDVWGANPRYTPYMFYDNISTENSTIYQNGDPVKSMILFDEDNIGHSLVSGALSYSPAVSYLTSMLLWKVKYKTDQQDYFKLQSKKLYPDRFYYKQYSHNDRRTIANFERSNAATVNHLGGDVRYYDLFSERVVKSEEEPYSPHYTKFLKFAWDQNPYSGRAYPKVRFYIPSSYKDFSRYKYISLRVAQRFHSYNKIDRNQNFYVRITDRNGNKQSISINKHGVLPYPVHKHKVSVNNDPHYVKYNGMSTITIPLTEFSKRGVNIRNVKHVSLRFTHTSYRRGAVVVDNIELVK